TFGIMKFLVAEVEHLSVFDVGMIVRLVDKSGVAKHRGNAEGIAHRRNHKDQYQEHEVPDARAGDQPAHFWPEGLAVYFVMVEQTTGLSKIEHLTQLFRTLTLTQTARRTLRAVRLFLVATIVSQPKFRRNHVTKTRNNRAEEGLCPKV